jgi:hypothetical protein
MIWPFGRFVFGVAEGTASEWAPYFARAEMIAQH